jgi:hypothetical protein
MIVDSEKIIADTLEVFNKSPVQRAKFSEITSYVSQEDYKSLHSKFLTPLSIKINCEQFLEEISHFNHYFEQWGTQHIHLPRYGLALVNQDGKLKSKDPINGSLYEWNLKYPDNPIIETDCLIPTDIMNINSLQPLRIFDGHWCRSNIFKWDKSAEFKPHIDTVVPSPWIRLWATTESNGIDVRYADNTGNMIKEEGIERGRIYIIDTSIVHYAASHKDNIYQLFLAILPSAINILKDTKCRV